MSCSFFQSLSSQHLNAACASSHSMLWSTSLLRHTTLHLRHKINFQIVRLWDDQLSASPDIQSASARLIWFCRLRTVKYERMCSYCEFESSCHEFQSFLWGFQPIPIFIELSSPLLSFSYPPYMCCLRCIHLSAVHDALNRKKKERFLKGIGLRLWSGFGLCCNKSPPSIFKKKKSSSVKTISLQRLMRFCVGGSKGFIYKRDRHIAVRTE